MNSAHDVWCLIIISLNCKKYGDILTNIDEKMLKLCDVSAKLEAW